MILARHASRRPDNGTQVFPTRKTLAWAHATGGRSFEDLDMSLTLSDLGEHVSNRDIHAATDGDVEQRSQRAERCGFRFQASTTHDTHPFRQRTRDQTQLAALRGLKCQRWIGQSRSGMDQAAAPDGDTV